MTFKNVGDGIGGQLVAEIRERTQDAVVTPVSIFLGHTEDRASISALVLGLPGFR